MSKPKRLPPTWSGWVWVMSTPLSRMPSAATRSRIASISHAGSMTTQSRVCGSPTRYTKFCIGPSSICLTYRLSLMPNFGGGLRPPSEPPPTTGLRRRSRRSKRNSPPSVALFSDSPSSRGATGSSPRPSRRGDLAGRLLQIAEELAVDRIDGGRGLDAHVGPIALLLAYLERRQLTAVRLVEAHLDLGLVEAVAGRVIAGGGRDLLPLQCPH